MFFFCSAGACESLLILEATLIIHLFHNASLVIIFSASLYLPYLLCNDMSLVYLVKLKNNDQCSANNLDGYSKGREGEDCTGMTFKHLVMYN